MFKTLIYRKIKTRYFMFQLTFDSFTLGRFVSFTSDGCPDGALQISESNRPQVGGSWCGTSWGPSIYYSETNSVSIYVSLYRLSKDQNGYNFDFRMEYKFLRKRSATVRYGAGNILKFYYLCSRNQRSLRGEFSFNLPPFSSHFLYGLMHLNMK